MGRRALPDRAGRHRHRQERRAVRRCGGAPVGPRAAFASNVALGTFHPKTIVFFVAFAPQFVRADGSYALQAVILIATFGVVVGCTDTLYALGAARASHLLNRPGTERWTKRAGGGVLIAAGLATAAARD